MENFTIDELELAQKSLISTIHKNEKAYETLSQKDKPRTSQLNMISMNLKNFRLMLNVIENRLNNDYSHKIDKEDLIETLHAIPKYVDQIEKVILKFKEGTPQFTLAKRRILSYHISTILIQEALLN